MSGVQQFSVNDFDAEVLKSEAPVLVDFWAPWCGPCRMVALVVEEIAQEFAGRLKVGKVNVDENRTLASKYGIMSIPTLIIFKNGQEVERLIGYQSKGELASAIEKALG